MEVHLAHRHKYSETKEKTKSYGIELRSAHSNIYEEENLKLKLVYKW